MFKFKNHCCVNATIFDPDSENCSIETFKLPVKTIVDLEKKRFFRIEVEPYSGENAGLQYLKLKGTRISKIFLLDKLLKDFFRWSAFETDKFRWCNVWDNKPWVVWALWMCLWQELCKRIFYCMLAIPSWRMDQNKASKVRINIIV